MYVCRFLLGCSYQPCLLVRVWDGSLASRWSSLCSKLLLFLMFFFSRNFICTYVLIILQTSRYAHTHTHSTGTYTHTVSLTHACTCEYSCIVIPTLHIHTAKVGDLTPVSKTYTSVYDFGSEDHPSVLRWWHHFLNPLRPIGTKITCHVNTDNVHFCAHKAQVSDTRTTVQSLYTKEFYEMRRL